jgi:two-component system, OmpR family, response regulator
MHVLVVEDEPAILDFVVRGLSAEGYTVLSATDGLEGERLGLQPDVELVILDLMLPQRSGMEVLASLRRERPGVPVILLTARGEVEDRVAGLDGGASDYLVKPFAFAELAARVRAHLRQAGRGNDVVLRAGALELDLVARRASHGRHSVQLTIKESELLSLFLRRADRVLSREELLADVWGYDFDPMTNNVEVYVGYLRRKLREIDLPSAIVTVRSVGYRLRVDAA